MDWLYLFVVISSCYALLGYNFDIDGMSFRMENIPSLSQKGNDLVPTLLPSNPITSPMLNHSSSIFADFEAHCFVPSNKFKLIKNKRLLVTKNSEKVENVYYGDTQCKSTYPDYSDFDMLTPQTAFKNSHIWGGRGFNFYPPYQKYRTTNKNNTNCIAVLGSSHGLQYAKTIENLGRFHQY